MGDRAFRGPACETLSGLNGEADLFGLAQPAVLAGSALLTQTFASCYTSNASQH